MIVTESDLKKYLMICCYVCGKPMEVGQSYEKITTHSKKKIVVHTNCIGIKPQPNKMYKSIIKGLQEAVDDCKGK